MNVEDLSAVVTGAGSQRGIGRASAIALAEQGWNVAILDLDGGGAHGVAAEIADRFPVKTLGVRCDIASGEEVEAAVREVELSLPPIGALVNNAGIASPTRFTDVTLGEWDAIFAVNVRGTFQLTHRVVLPMALLGFTRALAREMAPHGVTANAITPGFIETDLAASRITPEKKAEMAGEIPVGRIGTATDIAAVVELMCRPESGYVTGVTWDVNGGAHIH